VGLSHEHGLDEGEEEDSLELHTDNSRATTYTGGNESLVRVCVILC